MQSWRGCPAVRQDCIFGHKKSSSLDTVFSGCNYHRTAHWFTWNDTAFWTLHDGMLCHRNRDVFESRAASATVTDDTSNAGDTISKRTNKADDTCKWTDTAASGGYASCKKRGLCTRSKRCEVYTRTRTFYISNWRTVPFVCNVHATHRNTVTSLM